MNNEQNLMTLLEQYIEDVNGGRIPRIYESAESESVADLAPLLELIALVEASDVRMTDEQSEEVKEQVMGAIQNSCVDLTGTCQ